MRLSLVVAAVFAAGIGALVAASALIPAETVRNAVISDIRNATGLEPTVRGGVSVSLFPTAMVSFSDVVLGDERDANPALAADRLTAKLRLLPLLIGQIEAADMSLTRPRLVVSGGAGRPLELVRPDGDARAHAQARATRIRARAVVLRNPHDRRDHHGHRRVARGFRRAVGRGAVVRLAVDLAQLRRDRPLYLARRGLRRERQRRPICSRRSRATAPASSCGSPARRSSSPSTAT